MADDRVIISDKQKDFFRELSTARKDSGEVDDIAVTPVLDAWASCLDWAERATLSEEHLAEIAASASAASDQLQTYRQTKGSAQRSALRSFAGGLHTFQRVFDELGTTEAAHPDIPLNRRKIERAADAADLAWSFMAHMGERFEKLDGAVAAAEKAASQAKEAVTLAEKAATESATGALEKNFATTASNNNSVAWAFRIGTLVILGVIVILAGSFAINYTPSADGSVDWHAFAYRVAILSAFGASAAYLGRQAGNYTRLSTWAHGIQIQLKAFPGFVNEIEDEDARQTMFALFGKRVLESPPDGKSSADDAPTNLIQPIFEQAAKLRAPQ